tara:strand:+ start:895 stop:2604 length:1710 start_codon:yes stop_codon:yes gene_type:complete
MAKLSSQKVFPKTSSRTPEQRVATAAAAGGGVPVGEYKLITKSILEINRNLLGIKSIIADDIAADKKEAADKKLAVARDADKTKKLNKENFLEKTYTKTIKKPIDKMIGKTKGVFDGLWKALRNLFGLWLIDKIQKMIKTFENDPMAFQNLKNEVIKALAVVGGIFLALNVGIPLLMGGIGALIGGMVTGIPSLLALLASPLVWLGISAVLARHLQLMSPTEKGIYNTIKEHGFEATHEKLKDELAAKKILRQNTLNPLKIINLGTEIAELEKQISAMEDGYWGTGDPNYRNDGTKANVPQIPLLNERGKAQNSLDFKNLKIRAQNTNRTKVDHNNITGLVQGYREISKLKQEAGKFQQTLLENPGDADAYKGLENVTKKITEVQNTVNNYETNSLPPEIQKVVKDLKVIVNSDGIHSSTDFNEVARLLRILYPRSEADVRNRSNEAMLKLDKELGPPKVTVEMPTKDDSSGGILGPFPKIKKEKIEERLEDKLNGFSKNIKSNSSSVKPTAPFEKKTPVEIKIVPYEEKTDGNVSRNSGNASEIPTIATGNDTNGYKSYFEMTYGTLV